jgi:hypothetical protein
MGGHLFVHAGRRAEGACSRKWAELEMAAGAVAAGFYWPRATGSIAVETHVDRPVTVKPHRIQ